MGCFFILDYFMVLQLTWSKEFDGQQLADLTIFMIFLIYNMIMRRIALLLPSPSVVGMANDLNVDRISIRAGALPILRRGDLCESIQRTLSSLQDEEISIGRISQILNHYGTLLDSRTDCHKKATTILLNHDEIFFHRQAFLLTIDPPSLFIYEKCLTLSGYPNFKKSSSISILEFTLWLTSKSAREFY